jgi:hypothetical protein
MFIQTTIMEELHMDDCINAAELVDIRDVSVDPCLSREERIAEYVRQIKDPCHFKCGKFTVTAKFAENGPTLDECLQRMML